MKYWDSSALVASMVEQTDSARIRTIGARDSGVVTWWATFVQCASTLARRNREVSGPPEPLAAALARLRRIAATWSEVWPSDDVREHAVRVSRVHALRAGDALQLAAAIVASDHQTSAMEFVTLDRRLADAADKEGFRVIA